VTEPLDRTLEALADPTRRAVVDLLSVGPLRSGALADALSLSPPTMSRHLRVLRRAGVVEEQAHEDDARVRVYRLRSEPLQELRGWVDEVSAFWGDQLEAFRVHAEQRAAVAREHDRPERSPTQAPGRRRKVFESTRKGKPTQKKVRR